MRAKDKRKATPRRVTPPRGNSSSVAVASRRIPLTITLASDDLAFIESCVSLREFDSVDKLFDAALGFYRRHLHALNAYAEDQIHKGYSRAEILESVEFETVVTKPR